MFLFLHKSTVTKLAWVMFSRKRHAVRPSIAHGPKLWDGVDQPPVLIVLVGPRDCSDSSLTFMRKFQRRTREHVTLPGPPNTMWNILMAVRVADGKWRRGSCPPSLEYAEVLSGPGLLKECLYKTGLFQGLLAQSCFALVCFCVWFMDRAVK